MAAGTDGLDEIAGSPLAQPGFPVRWPGSRSVITQGVWQSWQAEVLQVEKCGRGRLKLNVMRPVVMEKDGWGRRASDSV